jgi:hypothetical protein
MDKKQSPLPEDPQVRTTFPTRTCGVVVVLGGHVATVGAGVANVLAATVDGGRVVVIAVVVGAVVDADVGAIEVPDSMLMAPRLTPPPDWSRATNVATRPTTTTARTKATAATRRLLEPRADC